MIDLRYLWLRRNRLKELSTQLCTVRRLAVVHLESNFIEHISDAIGIMQHLKQLYACPVTLLRSKKMNFFFLRSDQSNVTLTKLTNNQIKELPDAIYKCNKLCILDMKENVNFGHFVCRPDGIHFYGFYSYVVNITFYQGNNFTSVPTKINRMESMKDFRINIAVSTTGMNTQLDLAY